MKLVYVRKEVGLIEVLVFDKHRLPVFFAELAFFTQLSLIQHV